MILRKFHRRFVPAVRKSKNLLIEGQQVQNRLLLAPTADGRSLGSVFGEAEFSQSLGEIRISGIRGYLSNCIHVVRGTHLSRCFVCDEQGGRRTPNEDKVIEERL